MHGVVGGLPYGLHTAIGPIGISFHITHITRTALKFCLFCLTTQAYQDSANCKLELQFAKQSGVAIVPVVMDPPPYKASGWLGIITAGAL